MSFFSIFLLNSGFWILSSGFPKKRLILPILNQKNDFFAAECRIVEKSLGFFFVLNVNLNCKGVLIQLFFAT